MRPASTSSPAVSTCTRTWSCRSAARSPATRSRPGSRAAAWGGVTTIVDMAVQRYGENVFDGLAEWHRKADGQCAIDYAFHQIIGGVDDESLKAMKYLTEHEGISSFKLFMAYPGVFYSDDGQILRAMQTAAECGAMIMMHAENGIAIDVLVQQALARGETDPEVPQLHPALAARGGGHAPRHRAEPRRRQRAALHRAHVGRRRAERGRCRAPPRSQRVRRDMPAVPVADARRDARQAGLRGCQVGVQHAGARRRTTTPTTSGRWVTVTRATCGRACA